MSTYIGRTYRGKRIRVTGHRRIHEALKSEPDRRRSRDLAATRIPTNSPQGNFIGDGVTRHVHSSIELPHHRGR